jgi:hypothetical protein
MSKPCPTVKIKFANKQGFALLDEVAFDPKVHTLYEEPATGAPVTAKTEAVPVVTKFAKKAQ